MDVYGDAQKQIEDREEQERIVEAARAYTEAKKDERFVMIAGIILWFAGAPFFFLNIGNIYETLGLTAMTLGAILYLFSMVLSWRTYKIYCAGQEISFAYTRKKNTPFFQELTKKFSDEPKIHLHMNDDGGILITDKRERNQDAPTEE